MRKLATFLVFFWFWLAHAATQSPTPAGQRLYGFEQRRQMKSATLLHGLKPQSVGPSIFSCRVTDVDVNPANPAEMYVAYASGGLWHSQSGGLSFRPVFEEEAAMTIGDIAVDWTRNVVWVGTGENNSSRSSYAGVGIYRSDDGGKTWGWRGLPESHHIGRIVLHPDNPDVLWVAALGALYSPNPERGVYRSADGGQTWQRTLFVNDTTGAIDLILDPLNPDVLYAATWERTRRAWHFHGAGEGSGIWKSTDSGVTWKRMDGVAAGFPSGKNAGRIGLTAGVKNGRTVLYACIDNQNPPAAPTAPSPASGLTKDQLREMSAAVFERLSDEQIADFLKSNRFPEKYGVKYVREQVRKGELKPSALVEYLEDANANLFSANYIGAEVYRSDDDGATWHRTHADPIEQMNFTYGYYFSNIRCAPNNPDQVYLLGFLIISSDDGGKTWQNINGDNVHVDHHALWVNPAAAGHLVNGNDGGLNITWDNGKSWLKCNQPAVGQFYAVAVDEAEPYNIYGGSQDNGVWYGPSTYQPGAAWHQTGRYPWQEIIGGDGMQIAIDTRDNQTVYTGYQFGNYFRYHKGTGRLKRIGPTHELGERPLRFNWQTPIHLSKHNQDILYMGAHRLYRSMDKGESWSAISPDLTQGPKMGNVPYGTLTSIHESPLQFGLLYAGSDDGMVWRSKDGGSSWTPIAGGLPERLWVSRIQASAHAQGRVWLSLNGYRYDDFEAYIYVSDDFGDNWRTLRGLPAEPVNVLREDPLNPDLIYVGTDHALYVSLDRGDSFQIMPGLPDAPVHDLAVQAKAGDLIVGTHGRSAYKISVGPLQKTRKEDLNADIALFDIASIRHSSQWGKKRPYQAPKDPALGLTYYVAQAGEIAWIVTDAQKQVLQKGKWQARRGFNQVEYDLSVAPEAVKKIQDALSASEKKQIVIEQADTGKYYLPKGRYIVQLEKGRFQVAKEFVIE
ncbi:MAG: WD40/YVTN/BNR-like repeat-containing protein [Saprospiraceae bacterium]